MGHAGKNAKRPPSFSILSWIISNSIRIYVGRELEDAKQSYEAIIGINFAHMLYILEYDNVHKETDKHCTSHLWAH